jgi:uncharacterized protein DUF6496
MPDKNTIERAQEDEREGKSASTQAGEFVREEMDHIREGKHGARSTKQAIAIGLSKARRAGVKLPPPKSGKASSQVRKKAEQDLRKGQAESGKESRTSSTRSRATSRALQREGHRAATKQSLSRQARNSAKARGPASRHEAAMKAVRTKGKSGRSETAKKAARTRSRERRAA